MIDETTNFYSDPEVVKDPHAYFDAARARCPVLKEEHHNTIMVTGHAAAMEVLTSRGDTYSSVVSTLGPIPPLPFEPAGDDIRAQLDAHRDELPWSAHLVCFDGEHHVRHRALLTRLLTHTRLKQNETYLREMADTLIDRFIEDGRCDVVPQYAHATTTYAISDLMGIPEDERAELLELIGAPPSQLAGEEAHRVGADPLIFLKERFDAYIAERLHRPSGDLISELAHSTFKDGTRPDADMVSLLARLLFGAGQDTTSRLIAMAVRFLADDQDLQARLRREPERIPNFLEEVLRIEGPVKVIYRLAQVSTTIADVPVPAGTVVSVCLSAASNDPGHFAEPARLDIDRPHLRDQLAFSRGVHGCPGAPLARLEARVAIERLLTRLVNIRLAPDRHGPAGDRKFRYEPTYSFRSLTDLHIEFDRA